MADMSTRTAYLGNVGAQVSPPGAGQQLISHYQTSGTNIELDEGANVIAQIADVFTPAGSIIQFSGMIVYVCTGVGGAGEVDQVTIQIKSDDDLMIEYVCPTIGLYDEDLIQLTAVIPIAWSMPGDSGGTHTYKLSITTSVGGEPVAAVMSFSLDVLRA